MVVQVGYIAAPSWQVLERTKTGVHNLFTFDVGNFGNLETMQLDTDSKLELVGSSDMLAYFAGGYAYSPSVSVVFDWNGSKYELASQRFPKVLLKKAQESWRNYSSHKFSTSQTPVLV